MSSYGGSYKTHKKTNTIPRCIFAYLSASNRLSELMALWVGVSAPDLRVQYVTHTKHYKFKLHLI